MVPLAVAFLNPPPHPNQVGLPPAGTPDAGGSAARSRWLGVAVARRRLRERRERQLAVDAEMEEEEGRLLAAFLQARPSLQEFGFPEPPVWKCVVYWDSLPFGGVAARDGFCLHARVRSC